MNKKQHLNDDWNARFACDFLGITRVTLRYWRDKVHPKKAVKSYSPYDLLIYSIIKTYVKEHRLKLSRLRDIDWNAVIVDFETCNFDGLTNKIFYVNLKENTYGIKDSLEEFNFSKVYNHFVELKNPTEAILIKIEN